MEWILGGLGALCCAGIIGGIGYGLYRCCTENDLTTEKEKHNQLFMQQGGVENMMVFNVRKITGQEIQFEITVPLDLLKLKKLFGRDVGSKPDDLPEFPQIINDINNKNTNSIAYKRYNGSIPYPYQLIFTISQNGDLKVKQCGAIDRNIHGAKSWKRENMIQLLNILKSCVWSRKLMPIKTLQEQDLVALYETINQYANKKLFHVIKDNFCNKIELKESEDVIGRSSAYNLTNVNNDKTKGGPDVMSANQIIQYC